MRKHNARLTPLILARLTPLILKTTMKGLIAVLLMIASGAVVLAGDALTPDEPLPPEVKKLIGMKIPPVRVEGKEINKKLAPWAKPVSADYVLDQPANIPDWRIHYGMAFLSDSSLSIGVEELYKNNLSIFVITRINGDDKSKEILDARVLPQSALEYFVMDGKLVMKKDAYTNEKYFKLNGHCKKEKSSAVIALVRPEPNMSMSWSKEIGFAWEADVMSGHIKEIPTQGVACFIETGED